MLPADSFIVNLSILVISGFDPIVLIPLQLAGFEALSSTQLVALLNDHKKSIADKCIYFLLYGIFETVERGFSRIRDDRNTVSRK
jgi:hypothetical protein